MSMYMTYVTLGSYLQGCNHHQLRYWALQEPCKEYYGGVRQDFGSFDRLETRWGPLYQARF